MVRDGVGTMSLYRYVDGRDQLEELLVGLVLDSVDTEVPPGARWDEKVTVLVGRVWKVVGAHPAVVPPVAHPPPQERGRAALG
jgi:hypothetical protein